MEELNERRKAILKKAKKFIEGGWFFCNNCRNITKTLIQKMSKEITTTIEAQEDEILDEIEIIESRPRHVATICPICKAELPYTPALYRVFYKKHFEKFLPITQAIRKEKGAERRKELRVALANAIVDEMLKQYKSTVQDIMFFEGEGQEGTPPATL